MIFDPRGSKTEVRVCESRRTEGLSSGMTRMQVTYCNAHKNHREFLSQLARRPEVQEMGQNPE